MIKQFSKRNVVWRDGQVIIKQYADDDNCIREAAILGKLAASGVAVPQIIAEQPNVLILSYLSGQLYVDHLHQFGMAEANALVDWHESYHRVIGSRRPDVNLRNYIYCSGLCYGIDFEAAPPAGDCSCDYGSLLAYMMSYAPICDPCRDRFVRSFVFAVIQRGLSRTQLLQDAQFELNAIADRRQLPTPIKQAIRERVRQLCQ